MATISRTVCDLHLTRGEEVDATTRSIEVDGQQARVDLCDSCYQENIGPVLNLLERLRSPKPAETVPAKKTATAATKRVATAPAKKAARKRSRTERGPTSAAIRKWAREQGIEVSASGRVPREVRDQYAAAH
jgi:pyruvate/2-oxoglutarate dehydrogenase complex dihydrolipoamide acyltransferase (E2) component